MLPGQSLGSHSHRETAVHRIETLDGAGIHGSGPDGDLYRILPSLLSRILSGLLQPGDEVIPELEVFFRWRGPS